VTVDGDCDDYDPAIYPGAYEVAADGVDQDCDRVDNHPAPLGACQTGSTLPSWVLALAVLGIARRSRGDR
jgi:hypothetical protein